MSQPNKIVLLVDDDNMVNMMVETVLARNGYHVLSAKTGPETLHLLDQKQPEIDVALIDVDLAGGMSGFTLAQKIRAGRPDLKIIFSTGHDITTFAENTLLKEDTHFLQKPYDIPSLLEKIRNVLSND